MRFIKTYRELIEFENFNKKFKNIIKHFNKKYITQKIR